MTLYGVDVSNYQGGLSIPALAAEGFSWLEAKVSEGDYYADPTWARFRDAAAAVGMPIIGYHFAAASSAPAAQVRTWLANGGPDVCMLDFESGAGDIADYWALVHAFNAAGVRVALSYIPQWYWAQIGSPDLSQVPGLIASAYPAAAGYASDIYTAAGGDSGEGWASYGGANPVMWQFTNRASVAGMSVDANAFRGSLDELNTLLTGGKMTTPDQDAVLRDVREQLCGAGAREAGEYPGWPQLGGRTLVDGVAAIGAHLGIPGFADPKASAA